MTNSPEVINEFCIGANQTEAGLRYILLTLSTGKIKEVTTLPSTVKFNLKKYLSAKEYESKIYTVLGEVYDSVTTHSNDIDYNKPLGYLICTCSGTVTICTNSTLLELAHRYPIMNYSIVETSTSTYSRRNGKLNIICATDVERIYHLSFYEMNLHSGMSIVEIEKCMIKNHFYLGNSDIYTLEGGVSCNYEEGKETYMVYYNSTGTIIRLTHNSKTGLKSFGGFVSMGYLDDRRYQIYKNRLKRSKKSDTLSVSSVKAMNTIDSLYDKTTLHTFFSYDIKEFMRLSRAISTFSTPCIPYYVPNNRGNGYGLSPHLNGVYVMFGLSGKQLLWIENFIKKEPLVLNYDKTKLSLFIRFYIGMCNIRKYSPQLQGYYTGFLLNFRNLLKNEAPASIVEGKMTQNFDSELSEILEKVDVAIALGTA